MSNKNVWKSYLQHESASLKLFDHLIAVNDLKSEFLKYGLDETDIIFIKELIDGLKQNAKNPWLQKGRDKEKAFLYEVSFKNWYIF